MTKISPPATDDTVEVRGNAEGTKGGLFGNEYDSHEHRSPRQVGVGQEDGGVGITPAAPDRSGANIPAEAGRRGHVDQRTGAVHGSGAGAGGGPDEDLDHDTGGALDR